MHTKSDKVTLGMEKRIIFVAVAFVLATISVHAQRVRVIDKTTLQPIEDVLVYNLSETISSLTNVKGMVNLNEFNKDDTIVFQHSTYVEMVLAIGQIADHNFLVKMQERSLNLSEVIVSASKWEQNRNEVPNKITSISGRKAKFLNPQTSADLLGLSNEVFIQKSQFGGGSPMIRGFAANSVLIVVDGVRMNNAIFRSGNLQNVLNIDPNIIENAEVIFGPGSIIYGSDAMGGVMDFHTKRVRLGFDDEDYMNVNGLLRYSSASNEKSVHIDLNYGQKKWGFLTSLSFSDFDDLRMGSIHNDEFERKEYVIRENGHDTVVKNSNPDIQKFSGYDMINFVQKIRFRPNEHLDMNYSFIYSNTSDIPRYDRLIQYKNDEPRYAEWYYGPQLWQMHNLTVDLNDVSGLFDNVKIIMAYQFFEESRNDRKFKKYILRKRTEEVDALSINLDFDKSLNDNSTLFYGAEAIYNHVNSTGSQKNIINGNIEPVAPRYPDGGSNYTSLALYSSYKNNLNEFLTFTAGARYSHIILHADFDSNYYKLPFDKIDLDAGSLTGSLGLVYRPSEKWQFNLNASSGFRAPNIDDVAKVFDSEPGNVIVPNNNLKPEYAYNFDFGVIREFGRIMKIDVTVFYTYLLDAMVRRDFTFDGKDSIMYDGQMSKVESLVNVGHARIYGGSISLTSDLSEHIAVESFLTWQKGVDEDDLPVRHVPPLFGSTGITYTAEKTKIKLYAKYNGKLPYEVLAQSERDKPHLYASDANGNPYSPAWWTLNFKMSYQLFKNVQISAGVENIMDYRYRPYSSGICAPGRNLIVALRGTL